MIKMDVEYDYSNYHQCIIVNIIKYQPHALAENWFFTTEIMGLGAAMVNLTAKLDGLRFSQ